MPTRIRSFAIVSLAVVLGLTVGWPVCAESQNNTLLIVADDLGVDSVSTYGEGTNPPPTPTLNALAAQGVLFRNYYVAPTCSPTRAMLMTGRYGFRTGVGNVGDPLPLSETTLPEVLDTNNTAHALIGKWHLSRGNTGPNDAGWSHYAGATGGGIPDYYNWQKVTNGVTSRVTTYATTETVNDALAWIGQQTGPWVMSLNFNAPHTPFHAPPSNLHTYNLSGRPSNALLYKAAVQALDTEIGRLLQSLPAAVRARTNVIFMGDNGTPNQAAEAPFTRGRSKGSIYEGGTNVPLIVSGPIVQSPGREVGSLVQGVDLFPTIAELAGVNARAVVPAAVPLDGTSIVPYLTNLSQASIRTFAYTEKFGGASDDLAIRDDQYKVLRIQGAAEAFFDLVADPFELVDLMQRSLTPAEQEARDRLASQIDCLQGTASYFTFGTGTGGTLAPLLGQTPRNGQLFTVWVSNLPAGVQAAWGLLGLSRTSWIGGALPADLTAFGMPGSTLYVSPDAVIPMSINGQTAQWTLAIPAIPALNGMRFYQQALVAVPGANPAGLLVSNAGEGCVEAR